MTDQPFTLRRDPKPARQKYPQEKHRQAVLFCGLDDSPGQENLFPTDGPADRLADSLDPEYGKF